MTVNSGFLGTVTVNGTEVPIKNWNVNSGGRVAYTDNSKSGGFILRTGSGGKTAQVTFLLDYDFDSNCFASPIGIVPLAKLTNLKCYLNGTSGLFWNFPSVVVSTVVQNLEHESVNMINATITVESDGTYALPGAVTP